MRTVTPFDTSKHHIHVDFLAIDSTGTPHNCSGVVDTGAPWTEFSDAFLTHVGFLPDADIDVAIKPGLQTQKYAQIVLPSITLCGHTIKNFEVMVARFDPAWGIAALIGLDFFRRFKVTIDYSTGTLISEPL